MSKRRVVITGLGAVTPLGLNVEDTWRALLAGQSGVAILENTGILDDLVRISASVKNFDPSPYLAPKTIRKTDLFIQFGVAAAKQAIIDAGLEANPSNANRIGVAVGSGIGGLPVIEVSHGIINTKGPRKLSPNFIPSAIINMISGHVSIDYGFKGPNLALVTACTTGTHNIGLAARLIAYGDADVMIAGGAEMATCPLGLVGFGAMRALSTRCDEPTKASRPWDRDRDGFILGDGAGALVLEEYQHAKQRGARIYAELSGFGMSADAFHITNPEEQGMGGYHAMKNAIEDTQRFKFEDVDYINAHSTSTPAGDMPELVAIKNLFAKHAYQLAISSTKSMTGHLLGAAGAVEAIFSVLAIRDQIAPPTINLDNPDVGCEDLNLVPHLAQKMRINVALSNSFGFGGTNGCLVFNRVDQ